MANITISQGESDLSRATVSAAEFAVGDAPGGQRLDKVVFDTIQIDVNADGEFDFCYKFISTYIAI